MIYVGDCLEVMRALGSSSVDAVVTDPPYHLTNRGGGPGKATDNPYTRARAGAASRGFMGKTWDGGDVAFRPDTWAEVLRVVKPGAHLAAFGGTRTYHRLTCAIEDAGWELRDTLMWVYGSGFPKSRNIGGGWGTALKPAWEPIVLARKPFAGSVAANAAAHGTGALNIDGCRVPGEKPATTRGAGGQNGRYGPIEAQGRIEDDGLGRWPANLVHDGSDEVLACFPNAPGQKDDLTGNEPSRPAKNTYGDMAAPREAKARRDGVTNFAPLPGMRRAPTSAARFFYCAKASREDRNAGTENTHPTVKPTDLMRWLCRLVTPTGGLVLDPFAGSGSTGRAAIAEGFQFVGIELDPEYARIAEARIRAVQPGLPLEVV